ncbi:matrixin family metalloprotease [Nitrosopumilus sp.]|uniref:matrixin family metalloprotease n=1 Tax=Nitrosopumilus sp. TaxID=2024843 RepID=UPI00247E454C|nr:matrixin family metalloprotease [Nitrosopumilus sp.]MCV0409927.1 matrixin family metalloprotease [Nitrosopumilus sp.]
MDKQNEDSAAMEGKIDQISNQLGLINQKYEKLDSVLHRNTSYFFVLFCSIIVVFSVIMFSIYYSNIQPLESGHFITQSLMGDSIDTWLSWKLSDSERIFHVHIINHAKTSQKNIDLIKESIMSEEIIEINDLDTHKGTSKNSSKFYKGWQGVLNEFDSLELRYNIPIRLHVHESTSDDGDILILLMDEKNSEGYSGYTRSIIDEDKNQILKSRITIYESSKLDENKLAAITRHEMGHALGLQHSTDPDDLMYYKITTTNPFISECNVSALKSLYDGEIMSKFLCEK